MSYILQALKDSQRNRDDSRVPDLRTVHAVPEAEVEGASISTRFLNYRYLLLLSGVFVAVAGGWWSAGLLQEEVTTPVGVAELASPPPAVTVPQVAVDQPLVAKEVIASIEKAVEPESPTGLAKLETAEVDVPQPTGKIVPALLEETAMPDQLASLVVQPVASPVAAETENNAGATSVAGELGEQKIETPIPPVREYVPQYRELPLDIQADVSNIAFSVHLYSPDPQRRMVKIDGRVRREGSEITPGLILDEVTPRGAIFTYKDHQFRVLVR